MNMLIMMQGASGSSKSTTAKNFKVVLEFAGYIVEIFSTDEFFYINGQYKFDPTKLSLYHIMNLDRTLKALEDGKTVIVDNTNLLRSHCKHYVQWAVDHNIPVYFYRATGNFQNIHGVPDKKVEQMHSIMEDLTVESVLASKAYHS